MFKIVCKQIVIFRFGNFQVVVDFGLKVNKIGFINLIVWVERKYYVDGEIVLDVWMVIFVLMVVNVDCEEVVVNLNWEFCEFVEDIFCLYNCNKV